MKNDSSVILEESSILKLKETFLVVFLLLSSIFFRFYQINKLNFFTYDQARDALYMKRIIIDHKFRLIGTQSSIPGLYTGPAYYYMMVPFLFFFKFSPAGIDFGTAVFGVLTVFLVYYVIKQFTGNYLIGILIAAIYSTQPQILEQSRFSWNPNPSPFFLLLFILGLYKVFKLESRWWIAVFGSLGILLQLHYSGVCLFPVLFLFFLVYRKKINFGKWFLISLLGFIALMSPLLVFDLRHNFIGFRAIISYLNRGSGGKIPPPPFVQGSIEKLRYLLVEMPLGLKNTLASITVLILIVVWSIRLFLKNMQLKNDIFIVGSSLILGMLVASGYKGSFFTFYLTLMYPLGFLLIGIISASFYKETLSKFIVICLLMLILSMNIKKSFLQMERRDLAPNLLEVASLIAADVGRENRFNLVGVSGTGRFDYNAVDYRYFLETFYNKQSMDWDVSDYQKSKFLYLIDTLGGINPIGTNIWEVKLFNPKKILNKWSSSNGTVVYKLTN